MSNRGQLRNEIARGLVAYETANGALAGVRSDAARGAFIEQVVDSIRRVEYIRLAQTRAISAERCDPNTRAFDPLLASLACKSAGEIDEACWLIFLSIHCGKHLTDGWSLARQLYSGHGPGREWTWNRVSADPFSFRRWLDAANTNWNLANSRPKFGNHRKYVSLAAYGERGTGAAVEIYVHWVGANRSHEYVFRSALQRSGEDPRGAFDNLYRSLDAVTQFGRLAKFDYLCMLSKCGLANIEPASAYLSQSTGPLAGARRLFGKSHGNLDAASVRLANDLCIGMQVVEDSLCNWAKSPTRYKAFRG